MIYRDYQGQLPPASGLQYLYHLWIDATKITKADWTKNIGTYLKICGDAKYRNSKLLEHIELMGEIRVKIEVDGKSEDQILDEFWECQQTTSACEYQSACDEFLGSSDSPAPCRFLVLPLNLSSWNDSDPSTEIGPLPTSCTITCRFLVRYTATSVNGKIRKGKEKSNAGTVFYTRHSYIRS